MIVIATFLTSHDIPVNATTIFEYFDPGVVMTMAATLLNSLGGDMVPLSSGSDVSRGEKQ